MQNICVNIIYKYLFIDTKVNINFGYNLAHYKGCNKIDKNDNKI